MSDFIAIGNNEPLPDDMPEDTKLVMRKLRAEAGFDDNGNQLTPSSDPVTEMFEAHGIEVVDQTPSLDISTKREKVDASLEHVNEANTSLDNELRDTIWFGILVKFHMHMKKLSEKDTPRMTADRSPAYKEATESLLALIQKAREEAGLIERRQEVYQLWVWACDAHHKGLVSRAHGGYIRMLYRRFNDLTDQLQEQTGSTKYVHYGIDEDTLKPVDITELKKAVGKDNL